MEVIGYSYNAGQHCYACAAIEWPYEVLHPETDEEHDHSIDLEVNPIFATDELQLDEFDNYQPNYCETCHELLK